MWARLGLLSWQVSAMNLGLAAGAEAFQRRPASASRLMRLDERRSRCDRKQGAAVADEIEPGDMTARSKASDLRGSCRMRIQRR